MKSSYGLFRRTEQILTLLGMMLTGLGIVGFSLLAAFLADTGRLPPDQIRLANQMFHLTVAGIVIGALHLVLQPLIAFPRRRARLPNAIFAIVTSASLSCAIGFFIQSQQLSDHSLASSDIPGMFNRSREMLLASVIVGSVINYIPIMIFTLGSSRWATPTPFEPVLVIHKVPQATQHGLDDIGSDNGRLARAYRAGRHQRSIKTAVSRIIAASLLEKRSFNNCQASGTLKKAPAQASPAQTRLSATRPGSIGQSSPVSPTFP